PFPPFLSPHPSPPHSSPLSLHDALPISHLSPPRLSTLPCPSPQKLLDGLAHASPRAESLHLHVRLRPARRLRDLFHRSLLAVQRSEEHTSELQSLRHLVCRLLLEKKKKN